MRIRQEREASGFQIAFFIFTVALLATPFERLVRRALDWNTLDAAWVGRLFVFVPAILLLVLVPGLRRKCAGELRIPIQRSQLPEVAAVSVGHILTAIAAGGAVVLWYWVAGGEPALARRLGEQMTPAAEWARALSLHGIILSLVIAGVIGPIVEELVFRAMLYRAWARQWGWLPSMLATSAVFAAYHPNPFSAFVGSILYITVLRRTGSLRACIAVHATYNTLIWYPLLGQFLFKTSGKETGEIHLWAFHLAVLALVVVALPVYVWMSRERPDAGECDLADTEAVRT